MLNRLLRRRSKKASKLCVTGICEGNPQVTDGFPSQRASNTEMFPFNDVIIKLGNSAAITWSSGDFWLIKYWETPTNDILQNDKAFHKNSFAN